METAASFEARLAPWSHSTKAIQIAVPSRDPTIRPELASATLAACPLELYFLRFQFQSIEGNEDSAEVRVLVGLCMGGSVFASNRCASRFVSCDGSLTQ